MYLPVFIQLFVFILGYVCYVSYRKDLSYPGVLSVIDQDYLHDDKVDNYTLGAYSSCIIVLYANNGPLKDNKNYDELNLQPSNIPETFSITFGIRRQSRPLQSGRNCSLKCLKTILPRIVDKAEIRQSSKFKMKIKILTKPTVGHKLI